MEFDRRGTALVINASDRCIRVYTIDATNGPLILHHKFQDLINRTPWNGCSFSKDGDYVCAGAGGANKGAHNVHIWDRATGGLSKILEGPRDSLEDLDVRETDPLQS